MASITSALAAFVMSLILREAPTLRDDAVKQTKYITDVATLVALHDDVSDGRLVNHDMDMLILTAVNYRESRLKNPSVDGDCHYSTGDVPSGRWPKGYVPTSKLVCNAVGPMQIAKGNAGHLMRWSEVATEFSDVDNSRFSVEDLRDPKTNIRIAYAELDHWKNECRDKGEEAPVGVWFTAYRYGHCPTKNRVGHFYIDGEAKIRCGLVQKMVDALSQDVNGLPPFRCMY